jgi:hypothetical protein
VAHVHTMHRHVVYVNGDTRGGEILLSS